MKRFILFMSLVSIHAEAQLQTCLPGGTPPSAPPRPTQMVITVPPSGQFVTLADGGTFACSFTAVVPGGAQPQPYGSSPAKCNTAIGMALQAAANDNGWNDGGVP